MLGVGRQEQPRKSIKQESNQFSMRNVYTEEMREWLDESNLAQVFLKNPSDLRRFIVTKGNKKKSI